MAARTAVIAKALGTGLFILGTPAILGWFAFSYSYRDHLPEAILSVEAMGFIATEQSSPPESQSSLHVALPDDWTKSRHGISQGWYRGIIELNVPPNRLWGIYVPTVRMNAAVYLNGELLGQGGRLEDPVARLWNRPLYFVIPNGMLRPGDNILQVRVKADPPGDGLLSPLYLGPDSELRPAFEARYFFRITVVQMITSVLFILAGVIGLIWALRPQDTLYGWFALAALTWGVHNLNLLVINSPLPTRLWDWFFNFMALGWFTILATIFIHRYLDLSPPHLERVLVAIGVSGSVLLVGVEDRLFYWLGVHLWDSGLLAAGLYPLWLLFRAYQRRPTITTLLLVAAGGTIIIFALHDWLLMQGLMSRIEGFFIQYSAPAVILGFSWLLLSEFVRSRDEAETLNRDLEQRIAEKTAALEANHQRLRELERQQVLVAERERIMRDMHDGMGGHLVSTLSMVEAGRVNQQHIAESLREALDDLRLMIDSLDPVEGDLSLALGMYRTRLEPRLVGSAVRIDWQVRDVPLIADFSPEKVLQVLRIIQEAVTNVLKHANANTLTVSTGEADDSHQVFIEVRDDGQGFGEHSKPGRGLANMRQRAQSINAEIETTSSVQGSRVRLWLPIQ